MDFIVGSGGPEALPIINKDGNLILTLQMNVNDHILFAIASHITKLQRHRGKVSSIPCDIDRGYIADGIGGVACDKFDHNCLTAIINGNKMAGMTGTIIAMAHGGIDLEGAGISIDHIIITLCPPGD